MMSCYIFVLVCLVFFFKQKTAYEMRISDWSSDVCSSDLEALGYLQKHPINKRYSLRVSTLALGYRYLLVNQNVERANPFLLDLNLTCGETVNYSEPDCSDMVYVGRFPTSSRTDRKSTRMNSSH